MVYSTQHPATAPAKSSEAQKTKSSTAEENNIFSQVYSESKIPHPVTSSSSDKRPWHWTTSTATAATCVTPTTSATDAGDNWPETIAIDTSQEPETCSDSFHTHQHGGYGSWRAGADPGNGFDTTACTVKGASWTEPPQQSEEAAGTLSTASRASTSVRSRSFGGFGGAGPIHAPENGSLSGTLNTGSSPSPPHSPPSAPSPPPSLLSKSFSSLSSAIQQQHQHPQSAESSSPIGTRERPRQLSISTSGLSSLPRGGSSFSRAQESASASLQQGLPSVEEEEDATQPSTSTRTTTTRSIPISRSRTTRTRSMSSSGSTCAWPSSHSSSGSTGRDGEGSSPSRYQYVHPQSLPSSAKVTSSSYSSLPYSPAVAFLANLVDVMTPIAGPDEEGSQVGEYTLGKVIGHGGFSVVREAFLAEEDARVPEGRGLKAWTSSNRRQKRAEKTEEGASEDEVDEMVVAVKIVRTQTGADDNDRIQRMLDKEIAIWETISHQNVVPLITVERLWQHTFIFNELCLGGHLLSYLTKYATTALPSTTDSTTEAFSTEPSSNGLSEDQARVIFNQVADALRYLHEEKRIVHRDIKLENILLHQNGRWKLCDFGLAEYQEGADREACQGKEDSSGEGEDEDMVGGSLAYCSPEQLRSCHKALRFPSTDVWSLGIVLYALLTGRLPFQDVYEPRMQYKILNGQYEDPEGCSAEAQELLRNMLRTKPDERWRIGQVRDSDWCRA